MLNTSGLSGLNALIRSTHLENFIEHGFRAVWLFLAAYWVWSARKVKRTQRTESRLLQLIVYWAPLLVAAYLLGPGEWFEGNILRERFVPHALWVKAVGLALATCGVLLACYARHILGKNWSSVVQIKQDHELIEAGPYRYVRHPIYTGLLIAILGAAFDVGDWRGLLALLIVFVSFWNKFRQEERWLTEQFGEKYLAYMKRTKALIPGVF